MTDNQRRFCASVTVMCLLMAGTCARADVTHFKGLQICGKNQRNTPDKTCMVDGDTLWLGGVNIRLKDFDTPESRTNICGGSTEINLAQVATDRLRSLLNGNAWTIETFGIDGTGKRRLATIRIEGVDVGDILIAEKLARRWPDGDEFWCR
ncbi:thermonuclease family protein [Loktanella sp. DJP18]|uniref:thermonuclease family protein n=1 Tax=Loktanella sp. DJP18 TaxID=3409788 RepID=UPI003BB52433